MTFMYFMHVIEIMEQKLYQETVSNMQYVAMVIIINILLIWVSANDIAVKNSRFLATWSTCNVFGIDCPENS